MKKITAIFVFAVALASCDAVNEKTKKTINEGGEVVGKTATEFIEGISEGVDKTLQCQISLTQTLIDNGLETGTFSIESDSTGGKNNMLVLYIIFNQDFSKTLAVKVFDKSGLEAGRTSVAVSGKAGEAKYYDFVFDKRTYIEAKSKLTIE